MDLNSKSIIGNWCKQNFNVKIITEITKKENKSNDNKSNDNKSNDIKNKMITLKLMCKDQFLG